MASGAASRRVPAPLLDPAHQRGLTSLLTQTHGKPVKLNLVPLKRPFQDPDILAQFVVQKLRDRRNAPRKTIRDAAWKADLPSAIALTRKQQAKQIRDADKVRNPLTLEGLTHGKMGSVTEVLKDMSLSQVSSIRVKGAGRLSKRLTANRADGKVAMRGASKKAATHWVRGTSKTNTAFALRSGKRRIGSFGVRIGFGYS